MEDGEPANAKIALPDSVRDYIDTCIEGYGYDAIIQALRDYSAKRANRNGVDATRLTLEQKQDAKRWRSAKNGAERYLRDMLDHGPGSGCK